MEELIIDEKKYISSKQAAKATGYAKDYVGQMCREGRVPAQLVGRSWYVLESAILDHRFGTNTEEVEDPAEFSKERASALSSWAEPRYEPTVNEVLPIVEPKPVEEAKPETVQTGDVYVVEGQSNVIEDKEVVEINEKEEVAKAEIATSSVEVERELIRDIQPASTNEPTPAPTQPMVVRPRRSHRGIYTAIRGVSAILVLALACLTLVSSGFVDQYLISFNQVSAVTGVTYYINTSI